MEKQQLCSSLRSWTMGGREAAGGMEQSRSRVTLRVVTSSSTNPLHCAVVLALQAGHEKHHFSCIMVLIWRKPSPDCIKTTISYWNIPSSAQPNHKSSWVWGCEGEKGLQGFFFPSFLGLWKLQRTHTQKWWKSFLVLVFVPSLPRQQQLPVLSLCLALAAPAPALGATTGPWHPLAALLSWADPFIPWHSPQMDFSWLGGLAIKIRTRMNHLQFIHGESHKLAAPVSHCLSHMPKYPPFSGHFSHQSHQKNPFFNRVGVFKVYFSA